MKMTLKELSSILNVCTDTLRTWVQGYRFAKFYFQGYVNFDKEFVENMVEFLILKRRHKAANNIKLYYKKNSCK